MIQDNCTPQSFVPEPSGPPTRLGDDAAAINRHTPRRAEIRPLRPRLTGLPPMVPTPLIGRDRELAVACARLRRAEVRLLTLTGPGGVGKTRLAQVIAADTAEEFADGVAFVDLAALDNADQFILAIAHAVGCRPVADESARTALERHLGGREVLLLLDSFERLLAAAPQVAALLTALPHLTVLATSRASLRLRWEHEVPIAPLAIPDVRHLPPPEILAANPAVALFAERAAAVRPEFALTSDNAADVAELCARLDGLPLALEQAAAQLKLLTVPGLLGQLTRGTEGSAEHLATGLLRARDGDGPQRHTTVDAMHLSSYEHLGSDERRALEQLAVCVDGCSLGAVEAIWAVPDAERAATLGRLAALVDHSYLQREEAPDGEPRFRILATLRPLLLDRLRQRGDFAEIQGRHAAHLLALAEEAARHLDAAGQLAWLDRLEADRDNLHAALRWCVAHDRTEWALRLAIALWRFWWHRGHVSAGRRLLADALAAADQPIALRPASLGVAGNLAARQGDYPPAQEHLAQSLALLREAPDRDTLAIAATLDSLGEVLHRQGDRAAAQPLYEESLALARRHDHDRVAAGVLNHLGLLALDEGDHALAQQQFETALVYFTATGDAIACALTLCNLGSAALHTGGITAAQAWFEHARAYAERAGARHALALAHGGLGEVAFAREDYAAVRSHYAESLRLARRDGDRQGLLNAIEGLAALAAACGEPAQALRIAAASAHLREHDRIPALPGAAARLTSRLARARRSCSDELAATLQVEGRMLTLDSATESALAVADRPASSQAAGDDPAARPMSTDPSAEGLTPREREVALLVARGWTNRQVADALSIAERTVGTHVAHILAKLALTSRVQIAAWSVSQQLTPSPE